MIRFIPISPDEYRRSECEVADGTYKYVIENA